ncbi:hypothetical protein TWF506_007750 [Arthrobotrys conoides]|uniref:Uncharacterized protein n=1 Tax=Arthrobotrys conoides TaxID=74498 RepID=A0AAN8RNF6_9PEZI
MTMDPNSPNIIIPSESLRWWAQSKIANWRYFVDIAGIKDADPKELSIFDWKIIFEIALRSSTWRLCPSMVFGESCEIPIFGMIQELDFVTGKVVFRLHPITITPLVKQHAKYIFSRRKNLPSEQAREVLQAFERRIDVLQIRLRAGVLDATDGTPGADFPKYASDLSARKSVVDMLSLVLKENGLRKTILDAFVEIQPSVPSFVFSPSRSLGGASTESVQSLQPTNTPLLLPPPQFPLTELHSLISKPQAPQRSRAEHNHPPQLPVDSSLKRKQNSTLITSPQLGKRLCTPISKIRAVKSSRPTATGSSPLATEVKWNDPLPPSPSPSPSPREPLIRQRSRKSPSACPSIDSGVDINTPTPVAANSPEPTSAIAALKANQPTLTIIPDERTSAIPSSSNKTTLKLRRVSLNHDELTIYKMDSSFAPITRQQAAMELKKTPNSTTGGGSVSTLKELLPQKLPSVQRSLSRNSKDTDEEEDNWYDTHEEVQTDHPQEGDRAKEVEAEDKDKNKIMKVEEEIQGESSNTIGLPKPHKRVKTSGINRFGLTLRSPGHDPRVRKRKRGGKVPKQTLGLDDYTDSDDLSLDSDTPTLELLCDSENSEDHRDRKYRRRERKKLRAERRQRTENINRLGEQIAMLEAELGRRDALETAEGADGNQSRNQNENEAPEIG